MVIKKQIILPKVYASGLTQNRGISIANVLDVH